MKLEARRNRVRLTLESNDGEAHSTLTDFRPFVEQALVRAAEWFDAEVERLRREHRPATVGYLIEVPGKPAVVDDPLEEFRAEVRR